MKDSWIIQYSYLFRGVKTWDITFDWIEGSNLTLFFMRTVFGWVNQWIRRSIDFDWYYNRQCVDLIRKYASDYWNPITTYGNAIDLWNKWLGDWWERVENSPNAFPKEGDIVLFSWPTKYGHIAIAQRWCSERVLNVAEQNAGIWNWDGKWENAIRRHTYDYITPKCLWWFTSKK